MVLVVFSLSAQGVGAFPSETTPTGFHSLDARLIL